MSRSVPVDEASSLIVSGFLRLEIEGHPQELAEETQRLLSADIGRFLRWSIDWHPFASPSVAWSVIRVSRLEVH